MEIAKDALNTDCIKAILSDCVSCEVVDNFVLDGNGETLWSDFKLVFPTEAARDEYQDRCESGDLSDLVLSSSISSWQDGAGSIAED